MRQTITSIADSVRRLHDTGRNGLLYLLIFFPIVQLYSMHKTAKIMRN
ncbi:MAG: DUF805 domain-containing protein [Planctomycetaceae bacterium]|nr:DUF805 domain-containing protein [Planctomycetaceae bacterium]